MTDAEDFESKKDQQSEQQSDTKSGSELTPDAAAESGMQWFILHAYSNCEDKVVRSLHDRIELHNMQDKFGEIIVPDEEVVEMYRGKKRKVRRKNFPGYIVLQMVMDEDTWYLVRNTPNVLGFLGGTAGKPVPITEQEANSILLRAKEGDEQQVTLRPKVVFEAGEVVRIKEGPFADFDGVVEHVNYEKNRLRVSVIIFGRATPVELEFTQVEKV